MAEKLTTYDPAQDLNSDDAIAIFMAEAFQTNDAGYMPFEGAMDELRFYSRALSGAEIAKLSGKLTQLVAK